MNELMMRLRLLAMLAPDGGDGGGDGSSGEPAPAGGDSTPPAPGDPAPGNPTPPAAGGDKGTTDIGDLAGKANETPLPKWSSQLPPEKRESEAYRKHLYGHQSLEELSDAYVSLAEKQGRSLELPGKDATPDQIKAFLGKLGLPEDEAGYDLPNRHNDQSAIYKELENGMRKQFYRNGLTKRQATAMWEMIADGYSQSGQYIEAIRANKVQTFDARLGAALKDTYPVQAERDNAARETMTLFAQHVQRTGLGKAYKDSGLLYDPSFVMAIAQDEKARGGSPIVQGGSGPAKAENHGAFGVNYSKDFLDAYGKK